MTTDEFTLYDLKIEVVHHAPEKPMICQHGIGEAFFVKGGRIEFPAGQEFGLYAMLAVLPFVPAKQRPSQASDWMAHDAVVGCTDPRCGAGFKITRLAGRAFGASRHAFGRPAATRPEASL
ncbi:MAG: TIGR04076 family protein [Rhodospirillaceae bacterium]|nr:TIGR04076 family protein [Rhodospirillaceae bacterium]